jgi:Temperature dependent protein affecting M2 dsRNA replication
VWRCLQLRNFINEDHTLSAWGQGLAAGLEKLGRYPDLFDSVYLGLELVRLKVLNHENFSIKYSGGPMFGSGLPFLFIRGTLD